jgi:hypothetical protein
MNMKQFNGSSPQARHDAYFSNNWTPQFGAPHEDPDGLHLKYKAASSHYSLTATQYFGFHVPQQKIHAFLYLWHHPNLGMISGGPMVWQGVKPTQLSCELYDYRAYMSDDVLTDFRHYKLDNGYEVEVLDGDNSFHTSYSDPSRHNQYSVTHTAISELLYWPSGTHFEQVMRTKGELVLRGKKFKIDGFHVRDRSWGENRTEEPFPVAPIAWTTGVFDEGFAFNVTGSDDPNLGPNWKGRFDIASKETFKFGWIIVDGTPSPIVSMRKLTTYNAQLLPQTVSMEIHDIRGRKFEIEGTLVALSPCLAWPNVLVHICLFRWECNGQIGWGDHQEAQWTDFLQGASPPPSA